MLWGTGPATDTVTVECSSVSIHKKINTLLNMWNIRTFNFVLLFYWSHIPGGSLRWDSMFWSLSSTTWFPQSLFMDPCCWSASSACVPLVWGPYVFITRVTAIANKHWLMLHKSPDHPVVIISLECEGKYVNYYSHSVYKNYNFILQHFC